MIVCDTCKVNHPKNQYIKRIGSDGIFKDCEICRFNLSKDIVEEDYGHLYIIKSIYPKGYVKIGKTSNLTED